MSQNLKFKQQVPVFILSILCKDHSVSENIIAAYEISGNVENLVEGSVSLSSAILDSLTPCFLSFG